MGLLLFLLLLLFQSHTPGTSSASVRLLAVGTQRGGGAVLDPLEGSW